MARRAEAKTRGNKKRRGAKSKSREELGKVGRDIVADA
jgi:hypothetical protein